MFQKREAVWTVFISSVNSVNSVNSLWHSATFIWYFFLSKQIYFIQSKLVYRHFRILDEAWLCRILYGMMLFCFMLKDLIDFKKIGQCSLGSSWIIDVLWRSSRSRRCSLLNILDSTQSKIILSCRWKQHILQMYTYQLNGDDLHKVGKYWVESRRPNHCSLWGPSASLKDALRHFSMKLKSVCLLDK